MAADSSVLNPVLFDSGPGSNFYVLDPPLMMRCPLCCTIADFAAHHVKTGEYDRFGSTEHYFHCSKVLLLDGLHERHKWYETIRDAKDRTGRPSPSLAKRLGRGLPLLEHHRVRWDWVEGMQAMLRANLAKFHQNEECRQWLLATGEAPLVEHRADPIWGDNLTGGGMNLLGKILELVRARMRGMVDGS